MDAKSSQIAYQVAWKAAVELISAKVVELSSEDVGAEVKELADVLFAPLKAVLGTFGDEAPAAPSVRSAVRRAPSARGAGAGSSGPFTTGPDDRWELTDEACPEDGCDGVLMHNTTTRGPEWQCSKVQRKKVGTRYVDVGTCTYTDWGANGKSFG